MDDGTNQYKYDGEGRVCAVYVPSKGIMMQYIYDAEGRRMAKGRITTFSCSVASNGFQLEQSYIRGQSGEEVTELDQSNHWVHTNVYAGSALLATFANDNLGVHFHLTDWIYRKIKNLNTLGRKFRNI